MDLNLPNYEMDQTVLRNGSVLKPDAVNAKARPEHANLDKNKWSNSLMNTIIYQMEFNMKIEEK